MEWNKWNRLPLVLVGTALLVAMVGCPSPTPPPEAVLAGTWQLVPTEVLDPPLTSWLLTFDTDGNLTKVVYTFSDAATATWDNPPSATNVDGTSVYISVTNGANGLTFSGTLDSTNTVITGTVTATLAVGNAIVTIDHGPATLTKQ